MKIHLLFDDEVYTFNEVTKSIEKIPFVDLPAVPRKGEYIYISDKQIDQMIDLGLQLSEKDISNLRETLIHKVKDVFYYPLEFIFIFLEVSSPDY